MNTKTKAILAYIIIFIVGAGTGFLLNNAIRPDLPMRGDSAAPGWFERVPERMQRGFRQGPPREMRGGMHRQLVQELELTDDQVEPFIREMIRFRKQMGDELRGIRGREREIAREEYREFRSEMADMLNEEQLQKLDQMIHPDSLRMRSNRFRRDMIERLGPRNF
jgi:hypothetical protein